MCGIAGTVGAIDDQTVSHVQRMLEAMVHRGPDQDGLWPSANAVLGHRRLSILDLSEAGRQPMIDETSGLVIVFNGECYNFAELRRELEALGRRFVSTTDTEVILAACAEWGEAAIERLRGMFALALWDPRAETLLLARDRLGIKPLYYTRQDGRLVFASELRALLATGSVQRKLDPEALAAFLWHGFVPGPSTLVQNVRLLEAGVLLRVGRDGEIRAHKRYWRLPRCTDFGGDAPEAIAQARAQLEQAVQMHLVSDVPLGIFLSGGVDSSVIAAMAQRGSRSPVTTFNIRFEEASHDESFHARQVAGMLGTDHREVTLTEQVFAEQLEDALACIDQPTFDGINTYFVSRAVREAGLTVALAGTGGDELFGGYASFADLPKAKPIAVLLGRLPSRVLGALSRTASRIMTGRGSEIPPQTRWGKLADVLETRGDLLGLYQVSYALFSRSMLDALALRRSSGLRWGLYPERAEELTELIRDQKNLTAISLLELSSFLGERLLRDTDSASMAVSLEVRVPLLDHVFLEALAQVPEKQRFEPIRQKNLLRQMVREQVDPRFFDRDKAGFELPLDLWCRRSLSPRLRETFRDLNLAHAVGLNAETVGRVWRAFEKGGSGIYWSRVWSLFVLMQWCRRHGVYA